jgi:uncharacterized protein (TIGR02453 family)
MLEKSFDFLQQLKQNNNRDWYHANKSIYNSAKDEFEQVTELLIHEINEFDRSTAGITPKDCIFRIFRDIRFSHDKTPYKTNFGSYMVKGGKKSIHAGYYLHIEPGGSFVAGGIYMPPGSWLKAIRQNIYEHIDEFTDILNIPDLKREFGEISGEKLKKPPVGFPKEFPAIELLKFKSYDLLKNMPDSAFKRGSILKEICDHFRIMYPFIRFLNESEEYIKD